MNGVHDLGGMQGFGAINPAADEPIFHAPWERDVLALTLAIGARGVWNLDESRFSRESIPPVDYLSIGYYRIWLTALVNMLEKHQLLAADALYAIGDSVKVKNLNPTGHTRLPRYIRGRRGVVHSVHGCHIFPDTHAAREGEQPQWLYNIRFPAAELWGGDASGHVHVDCWESYLTHAGKHHEA